MVPLDAPSIATAGVRIFPAVAGFQARLTTGLTSPLRIAGIAAIAVTAGLTAALVGVGFASAKAFGQVELSLAKIVGLVGVNRDQVALWQDDLLDLSPAVLQGPQELAEALFFVTSAGFRGAAAMDVLEISAKAATAGLGSVKSVADAITSAVSAYGAANLTAAEAGDILVATVREGKVEASALAGTLGRVIPIAAELGVSFDDVGAALATMTRVGLSAEEATTALRGIFNAILKPGSLARKTLEDFNLSAGDLRERLSGGESLLDILLDLKDRFEGNEDALARVFPRVRGLVGVLSLVGENAKTAEAIFGRMDDTLGDLGAAFDAVAETDGAKLIAAQQEINIAMQRLGQELLPEIAQAVTELIPIFEQDLVPAIKFGIDILFDLLVGIKLVIEAFHDLEPAQKIAGAALATFALVASGILLSPVILAIVGLAGAIIIAGNSARNNAADVSNFVEDLIKFGKVNKPSLEGIFSDKEAANLERMGIGVDEIFEAITRGEARTGRLSPDFFGRLLEGQQLGDVGNAGFAKITQRIFDLQRNYDAAIGDPAVIQSFRDRNAAQADLDHQFEITERNLADGITLTEDMTFATDELKDALAGALPHWSNVALNAGEYGEAIATAKGNLEGLINAELRAADPAFRFTEAVSGLAEAQQDLEDANDQRRPRATAGELETATLKVLAAQAELNAATDLFALNQGPALEKMDELAEQAGVTGTTAFENIRDGLENVIALKGEITFRPLGVHLKETLLGGLSGLQIQLAAFVLSEIEAAKRRIFDQDLTRGEGSPFDDGNGLGFAGNEQANQPAFPDSANGSNLAPGVVFNLFNPQVQNLGEDVAKAVTLVTTANLLKD